MYSHAPASAMAAKKRTAKNQEMGAGGAAALPARNGGAAAPRTQTGKGAAASEKTSKGIGMTPEKA